MSEKYDVIILGTGLTECILSGIFSVEGKKVLHVDRQKYYGGETASLDLKQLHQKFNKDLNNLKNFKGKEKEWCIDIESKFLMANGELTKILVHTDVTRYISFKQIAGSYVYRNGIVAKLPSNNTEALKSSLMGMFEKRRMKKFLEFITNYKEEDITTHCKIDLNKSNMRDVYENFNLENGTKDFIGHGMALWSNDDYLDKPAKLTYERILLYINSITKYGKSPYIYPMYGLSELPQGFARLSAIYGGTYMLDTPIEKVLYYEDDSKKFRGIVTREGTAEAPIIISDPSYFPDLVKKNAQRIIRAICILDHPIPNTNNLDSIQLIIPQRQLKRSHDIYIIALSHVHCVVPQGYYLAIISTVIETDNPVNELDFPFKLIGPRLDTTINISEVFEPLNDGRENNIYISKSNDSSSHFESTTDNVKDIYYRITGNELIVPKRSDIIVDDE